MVSFVRSQEERVTGGLGNCSVRLLKTALKLSSSADKTLRIRTVTTAFEVLQAYQGLQMDVATCEYVVDVLASLLSDRAQEIRIIAAKSLAFVDPSESSLEAISVALYDSTVGVRCEALRTLASLGCSADVVSDVILRIRDPDKDVRRQAYVTLSKCDPKWLQQNQMREIAVCGCNESDGKVRVAFYVLLLGTWLPYFSNDPEKLMQQLEVEPELQEELVVALLKGGLKVSESYFRDRIDNLSPEAARLWKMCVRESTEEVREQLLPTLQVFCSILQHYGGKPVQFSSLCSVVTFYDLGMYENLRNTLSETFRDILRGGEASPEEVRAASLEALKFVHPEPEDWAQVCVELITEMTEDTEDIPLSTIEIAQHIMQDPRQAKWLGRIVHLNDSIFIRSIQSEDPQVRAAGIRGLGLFCLFSIDSAVTYFLIFAKVLNYDVSVVVIEALKVLFDFCVVFGAGLVASLSRDSLEELKAGPQCAGERDPLLARLLSPLEDKHSKDEILDVCKLGLAKLLLHERLLSPPQLGRALCMAVEGDKIMENFIDMYAKRIPKIHLPRLRGAIKYPLSKLRGSERGEALRKMAAKWNVAWDAVVVDALNHGCDIAFLSTLAPSGSATESLQEAMLSRLELEKDHPDALKVLSSWASNRNVRLPLVGARAKKKTKRRVEEEDDDDYVFAVSTPAPIINFVPSTSIQSLRRPRDEVAETPSTVVKAAKSANPFSDVDEYELSVEEASIFGKRLRYDLTTNGTTEATPMAVKRANTAAVHVDLLLCTGVASEVKEYVYGVVAKLGGNSCRQSTFSKKITHVVSSASMSSKKIAAALCGAWVLPLSWVEQSEREGHWLPEANFGVKYEKNQSPVYQKKVWLTPEFLESSARSDFGLELPPPAVEGMFFVLADAKKCFAASDNPDVILTTDHQKAKRSHHLPKCKILTWDEFLTDLKVK